MAEIHVIDDEAMIGMLISYVLKKLGHDVHVFRSGEEFFSHARNRHIDCVMTDFIMPKLDGFELCHRMRLQAGMETVPIILMTGFEIAPPIFATLKQTYGIVEILSKPFTVERLIAATQLALRIGPASDPFVPTDPDQHTKLANAVRAIGQRMQPRIGARLPVQFSFGGEFADGYTLNVSVGGIFVATQVAAPQHARVTIRVLPSPTKAGLELEGTVAHVGASEGVNGFGVALSETNIHRFYGWYDLIARLNVSSGRHSADEVLVLGLEPHLVSPLQRIISLFCMAQISLTPVNSWHEALAVSVDEQRSIKLLLVNVAKRGAELLDLGKLRAYRGKIALLGLAPEARDQFPADLDLACVQVGSMRELVDSIGHWLGLPIRTSVRVPLMGEVKLDDGRTCLIGDVSVGGMRLISTAQLARNTQLQVTFELPGVATPMRAAAEIRWSRRERADRWSSGIAFINIDPAIAEAIEHYVITQWSSLIEPTDTK